jgi:hypothetical protein
MELIEYDKREQDKVKRYLPLVKSFSMTLQLTLCMLSTDRKRIYSENKMAANYRDKRGPSASTPEHHVNIYSNLDLPNV